MQKKAAFAKKIIKIYEKFYLRRGMQNFDFLKNGFAGDMISLIDPLPSAAEMVYLLLKKIFEGN